MTKAEVSEERAKLQETLTRIGEGKARLLAKLEEWELLEKKVVEGLEALDRKEKFTAPHYKAQAEAEKVQTGRDEPGRMTLAEHRPEVQEWLKKTGLA